LLFCPELLFSELCDKSIEINVPARKIPNNINVNFIDDCNEQYFVRCILFSSDIIDLVENIVMTARGAIHR